MNILEKSWTSFSPKIAKEYLKSFGNPSQESKLILYEVLESISGHKDISILDVGCGNGNLAEFLSQKGLKFSYAGVDFSSVLLNAAREIYPGGSYIHDDVNILSKIEGSFDVAVYSHVLELLTSPHHSLNNVQKFCKKIVIRFYEPPSDVFDRVDLLELNVGGGGITALYSQNDVQGLLLFNFKINRVQISGCLL